LEGRFLCSKNETIRLFAKIIISIFCNNINTAKVDAAAAQGAETAACVQRACGTRFNCGQCRADIDARLAVVRMNNPVLEAAE